MNKNSKFIVCALGIFVYYFYFGVLQEKITRGQYTSDVTIEEGVKVKCAERFTCFFSLVFVQCVLNYLFAKAMLVVSPKVEDKIPILYCASAALTYLIAMICSNMALKWVSYPTQVVGKASKPIPVMLLAVLIGKKSYPMKKYLFVVLIVLGIVLFMYKDQPTRSFQSDVGFGIGEILLLVSLIMDGLLGAVQERMRAELTISAQNMMLEMNLWSAMCVGLLVLVTGEGIEFISFVTRHPIVILHISALAVAGALGQLFIFLTVTEFGSLPCSVITTTRKFFTVLISVLLFGNVLTTRQWIGAAIVFTGLFLDAFFSKT